MESKSRKQQEKEFHDHLREDSFYQRWSPEEESDDSKWSNVRFYSIERKSRHFVENWLQQRSPNKRVLDYCCGNGADAIFAAQSGAAEAVGIDISDVSIANCKKQAIAEGVADRTSFHVMDAEGLSFPDAYFDLVVIYGVLHHLDFPKAMSELARVLKPDGSIIATEALRHNPIFHLYRKRTPNLRTPWEVEHILSKKHLQEARKLFGQVEARFYHLSTLAAVPFRKTRLFHPILTLLETIDRGLLSLPGLKWWGWQMVFTLSQPQKLPPNSSTAKETKHSHG